MLCANLMTSTPPLPRPRKRNLDNAISLLLGYFTFFFSNKVHIFNFWAIVQLMYRKMRGGFLQFPEGYIKFLRRI